MQESAPLFKALASLAQLLNRRQITPGLQEHFEQMAGTDQRKQSCGGGKGKDVQQAEPNKDVQESGQKTSLLQVPAKGKGRNQQKGAGSKGASKGHKGEANKDRQCNHGNGAGR